MLMQLFAAGADDESSPAHQQVLAVVNRMVRPRLTADLVQWQCGSSQIYF